MADIFNNTDNLYWVFTAYGKERLASLLPEDKLHLYKGGIGNYNWYEDERGILGEAGYTENNFKKYFESSTEVDLASPVEDGKVYINNKNLELVTSEDPSIPVKKIVTLTVTIPEDLAGFDIREFGIYETIDGVDTLFAVCTMQPIGKPPVETNHYLSVQLNARLQSEVLSSHYDQITLDPNNNFATVEELVSFEENLLFVESNLAEQISNNARIIGYNRPQQLYEEMVEDKKKYSNFATSTTFANFLNATQLENIKSFWVFQPNNDATKSVSIADLSYYGINMGTNKLVTLYETGYEGLASWLNFDYNAKSGTGSYFMLDSDIDFDLVKTNEDGTVEDTPFTLFFIGAQNTNDHDCTIIAKDNSAQTSNNAPAFSLVVTKERQLRLRLFTDRKNYVEYTTSIKSVPEAGEFYVAAVTYTPIWNVEDNILIARFSVLINGKKVNGTISKTGEYSGMVKTTLPLTSRVRTSTEYTDYIDSKVCLISLVKDNLSTDYIRATTYNMMALIGVNPCLIK